MLRFEILAGVLALAGTTCALSSDRVYCPPADPRCAAVDVAISEWNAVLPDRCAFRRGNDLDGWIVDFMPPDEVRCARIDRRPCGGYTDSAQHVIQVSADSKGRPLVAVLAHEMGHTRKLSHTCVSALEPSQKYAPGATPCGDVSLGVMDPDHPSSIPTEVDLAEYRRAGECP